MDGTFHTWSLFDNDKGTWTNQNGKSIDDNDKQSSLDNYFLIGMTSYHDNGPEDRVFKFFYAYSPHYDLRGCGWNGWTSYHDKIDYDFGRSFSYSNFTFC